MGGHLKKANKKVGDGYGELAWRPPTPHKKGGPGRPGGAGNRRASAIELIYMIEMVLTRASGTVRASRLKQNKFLMRACGCVLVCVCVPHAVLKGV